MKPLKALEKIIDSIRTRAPIVYNSWESVLRSTKGKLSLWSTTQNLPKGRYLVWVSMALRTDSQTARGELIVNGTPICIAMTNRSSDDVMSVIGIWDNPADLEGAHIELVLAAQSANATAYSAHYSYRSTGLVHLSRIIGGRVLTKLLNTFTIRRVVEVC